MTVKHWTMTVMARQRHIRRTSWALDYLLGFAESEGATRCIAFESVFRYKMYHPVRCLDDKTTRFATYPLSSYLLCYKGAFNILVIHRFAIFIICTIQDNCPEV